MFPHKVPREGIYNTKLSFPTTTFDSFSFYGTFPKNYIADINLTFWGQNLLIF